MSGMQVMMVSIQFKDQAQNNGVKDAATHVQQHGLALRRASETRCLYSPTGIFADQACILDVINCSLVTTVIT
jgi:hypothetical protein